MLTKMRLNLFIIHLSFLCAVFAIPNNASGQNGLTRNVSVPHTFRIFYPMNDTLVSEDYMSNPIQLDYIKRFLVLSPRVDSVVIHAFASPEGPYLNNKRLAEARARNAKRFLQASMPANHPLPDSLIKLRPLPENWPGLRQLVMEDYPLADSVEVLETLDRKDVNDEERKRLLKTISGGQSWAYISRHLLPRLRYSTWVSVCYPMPGMASVAEREMVPRPIVPDVEVRSEYLPVYQESTTMDKKTILAFKTNLLYDLVTWANYSVEVPIGKYFSALLYHQFPWWRWGKGNNQYCMRFLSLGAEARWWVKPNPRPQMGRFVQRDRLMGHFLGVYAESGKWDFEWGRKICHQGEHWSAGISYGYSMPLGRRLNMELSLSAGYASIPYRKFTPSKDYEILWRNPEKVGSWHYFGPTKAQVSLVYPILLTTKKKGDHR